MRRLLMTALVAGSLGLLACQTPPRPNIVLIVIDTLRADHLPFYGYDKDTAPFLAEWATQAVVFEHTYAASSWTAPSTASILTSLHPIQHGVLTGFNATRALQKEDATLKLNRVPDEVETLAEALKAAGYFTWAVTDNINISTELGFDQGFDSFLNFDYRGAKIVNRRLRKWQDRIKENKPYFLYLHYMDPHWPYHRRQPWYQEASAERAAGIAAYDSEIRDLDRRLRQAFSSFGWREDALVILTSDHGEEFGDHGGSEHGRTLYSEVLRVPLVIQGTGESRFPPRRVEAAVSLLDILPTIRELLGLAPSPQDQGRSLLALLRGGSTGEPGEQTLYADLRSPPWHGSRTIKAVMQDGWKYILTDLELEELYHLTEDPREQANMIESDSQQAAKLRSALERMEASVVTYGSEEIQVPLTEELEERLRALGYLQ